MNGLNPNVGRSVYNVFFFMAVCVGNLVVRVIRLGLERKWNNKLVSTMCSFSYGRFRQGYCNGPHTLVYV